MPKIEVAPTKSSLLNIKRDLAFAEEGYELLEQKRQILVMELMARLEKVKEVQAMVDGKMASAYAALREALVNAGADEMTRESMGITGTHELSLSMQRVMGLNLPQVVVKMSPLAPEFAPGTGTARSDDVLKRFREAVEAVAVLAEVENAVVRLARELKKTQRRVNALEKIFLPQYRETLKYIRGTLEERDREDMIIMKLIKHRREE
jgi:V/A-type H+-transporting ATPase subunit D